MRDKATSRPLVTRTCDLAWGREDKELRASQPVEILFSSSRLHYLYPMFRTKERKLLQLL